MRRQALKPKPEVGIQFGAWRRDILRRVGTEGTRDPAWAIHQMKRLLEAGAEMIMVESEGITENVKSWAATWRPNS